jgi:hypothetical protein
LLWIHSSNATRTITNCVTNNNMSHTMNNTTIQATTWNAPWVGSNNIPILTKKHPSNHEQHMNKHK